MSDRSGWMGTVAIAGVAIICCAGPLLVVGAASLGVGAWLAAHGFWLLGGLALLLAAGALIVVYRRRQASAACAVDQRGTAGSGLTKVSSEPNKMSGR
jgi:membrane protein implicated in regulation of membrane protease activity